MEKKHPDRLIDLDNTSFTRRSLLQWLGKATVLTLGAELMAACAPGSKKLRGASADAGSIAPVDGAPSAEMTGDLSAPSVDGDPGSFDFTPGAGDAGIFAQWPVRTVDTQQLTSILASWQLAVDGMVNTPRVLSFADLLQLPRQDQVTDFFCVEGWHVYDVPWNGVRLDTLLELAGPLPEATHVTLHTIGGTYNESLPLSVARETRTLAAYGIANATLPLNRGFPLRVVVPRLLGYKNPKYVHRIELADHPVDGYWVAAGYPYAGEVPAWLLRPGKY